MVAVFVVYSGAMECARRKYFFPVSRTGFRTTSNRPTSPCETPECRTEHRVPGATLIGHSDVLLSPPPADGPSRSGDRGKPVLPLGMTPISEIRAEDIKGVIYVD